MKVGDKVTLIRTASFSRYGATSQSEGYAVVCRRYKHINAVVIGLGGKSRFIKLDDPTIAVYMRDTMLRPEVTV